MNERVITICDVCTNPMRTRAEYEHAVCSSCRPAFNAGYARAMADVHAKVRELQVACGSDPAWAWLQTVIDETREQSNPLTDRDDS